MVLGQMPYPAFSASPKSQEPPHNQTLQEIARIIYELRSEVASAVVSSEKRGKARSSVATKLAALRRLRAQGQKEVDEIVRKNSPRLTGNAARRNEETSKGFKEYMDSLEAELSRAASATEGDVSALLSLRDILERSTPQPAKRDPKKLHQRSLPKIAPTIEFNEDTLEPQKPPVETPQELEKLRKKKPLKKGSLFKERLEGYAMKFAEALGDALVGLLTFSSFAQASDIPLPADLSSTMDAPQTARLKNFAKTELQGNPVKIFEFVRNNISFEPYFGSMKGAEATFLDKAGNDFDQASLLISLLRSVGVPARYVYGTISLSTGTAASWAGVEDGNSAADMLFTAGIPAFKALPKPLILVKHAWVEAYLPYLPDEGVTTEEKGRKMWVPMDPSLKPTRAKRSARDVFKEGVRLDPQAYLSRASADKTSPIQAYLDAAGGDLSQISSPRSLIPELHGILLDSLPAKIVVNAQIQPSGLGFPPERFSEIQDSRRWKAKFRVAFRRWGDGFGEMNMDASEDISSQGEFFFMLDTFHIARAPEISNKKVELIYVRSGQPSTATPEEVGDIFANPAQTHVRPVLKIEGAPVGQVGDPAGSIRSVGLQDLLWVDLLPPGESKLPFEHTEFSYFSGQSFSVFLNWSRVGKERLEDRKKNPPSPTSLATESYYTTSLEYFHQEDKDGDELGNVMRVTNLKQGAVGLFGLNMAVASIGDLIILSAVPAGVMITIEHDKINPFPQEEIAGSPDFSLRRKEYTFLYFLNASFWEYRILEVLDNVESISATKALQAAHEKALSLLTLATGASTGEIQSFLDKIPFQIRRGVENAVGAGFEVITATSTIKIEDWTGIAYITRHPETGIGAFIISGTMGESFTLSAGGNWVIGLRSRMRILHPRDGDIIPVGPSNRFLGEAVQYTNFFSLERYRQDVSDKIFWELFVSTSILDCAEPLEASDGKLYCRISTNTGQNVIFTLPEPGRYFVRANAVEFSGTRAPTRFFRAVISTLTLQVEDTPEPDSFFVSDVDTATVSVTVTQPNPQGEPVVIPIRSQATLESLSEKKAVLKVLILEETLPVGDDLEFTIQDKAGNISEKKEFKWTP